MRGDRGVWRRAARAMASAVEDGAALLTEQVGPTGWIATLVIREAGLDGHAFCCLTGESPIDGEKIDAERDWAEGSHLVFDVGGNGLGVLLSEFDVDGRFGGRGELEAPMADRDAPPGATGEVVGPSKSRRYRVLVPLRARSDQPEAVGKFGSVASGTVQRRSPSALTFSLIEHPGLQ